MEPTAKEELPARRARKAYCRAQGVTLEQLCRKHLRLHPQHLRAYERGENVPMHRAEQLAKLFGCRMEDFLPRRATKPGRRRTTTRSHS
jgi:hypothetical protein